MPQQRKKEESERLRGERYQIKFIDLGFERWQVVMERYAQIPCASRPWSSEMRLWAATENWKSNERGRLGRGPC